MSEHRSRMDREIIRRYTDQPERLPGALRRKIEDDWGGLPVQLYALVDLDALLGAEPPAAVESPAEPEVAEPEPPAADEPEIELP